MQTDQAIGLFDSGVGGLTVVRCVQQLLPAENLLYMADSAHAPYGDKSIEYIRERATHICDLLIEQQVKAIVIACNTATAAAATYCRERYTLPIIAMEPGVKPALALSKSGVVGVLATAETAHSQQLDALVKRYADTSQVLIKACPGLVELIEAGEIESDEMQSLLHQFVQPLLDAGVDTIVLGCSHYPIVAEQIQALAGEEIQLVETGAPVAKELERRLQQVELLNSADSKGCLVFSSSALHADHGSVVEHLTGSQAELSHFK